MQAGISIQYCSIQMSVGGSGDVKDVSVMCVCCANDGARAFRVSNFQTRR